MGSFEGFELVGLMLQCMGSFPTGVGFLKLLLLVVLVEVVVGGAVYLRDTRS